MMELVRLHEPLRIAASRHPAEIALMDEPVVHQRIDDAVEEDDEPDPRPRLPRRGAHDHRAAEYAHGNAHRGADDGEAVVLFETMLVRPVMVAVPGPPPTRHA